VSDPKPEESIDIVTAIGDWLKSIENFLMAKDNCLERLARKQTLVQKYDYNFTGER
jgi:hypothetical protein